MEIPEHITIDVSALHVGDSIHIRDISVPKITIKDSPEEVVAVVTHATREIVETPAAAEEGAEGAVEGAEGAATPSADASPDKKSE
jgi:large subunit ribosomal protein L25